MDMRFLIYISNTILRYATPKYVLVLLVLFIMIAIPMEKGPIGQSTLRELSGGTGMLDMEFGYNRLQVYNMLDVIGQAGRQLYIKLLGLDFIFAVVFMLFQSLMLSSLLKRADVHEQLKVLNLLPFVRSALDIAENCFLLTVMFNYPVQMPVAVAIASFLTISKLVVYKLIIVLLLSLGAFASWKSINAKRKIRKWSENV
jgi:hypothetical protein